MESCLDSKGKLYIDCAECNRGGNGEDPEKCSCGHKVTKTQKAGCFIGVLMDKYKPDLDELHKLEIINDMQKMGASQAQLDTGKRLMGERGIPVSVHTLMCDNSCIMMDFQDIAIGIESDGHAHS